MTTTAAPSGVAFTMKSSNTHPEEAVSPEVLEQCFAFEAWEIYGIDILNLDEFIDSGPLTDGDRASAKADRARASKLYADKKFDHAMEVIRHLLTVKQTVDRLVPVEKAAIAEKAARKVMNQKNAKSPRPNGRTVDHDEVITEFLRLTREGHTPREANGMLFARGLASRSTIIRITKQLITNAG